MIEPMINVLVVSLLVCIFVVLILALAVGVVLLLTALRILRKVHKVVGWFRWPRSKK